MKRLMNFLRGMVTLTVTGPFPERLVNLCAQEQVDFWAVTWLDGNTLRFVTRRRTLSLLRRLAERVDCQVTVEKSRGLPDFLLRFRSRYAFLAGLAGELAQDDMGETGMIASDTVRHLAIAAKQMQDAADRTE